MEEKQKEKAYSAMQLKMVYQRITEALDDKRKRDIGVVIRNYEEPIDAVDEILRIESECNIEKNKWKKILKIDEINKQDQEIFDKAFNSIPDIFKTDPFGTRRNKK